MRFLTGFQPGFPNNMSSSRLRIRGPVRVFFCLTPSSLHTPLVFPVCLDLLCGKLRSTSSAGHLGTGRRAAALSRKRQAGWSPSVKQRGCSKEKCTLASAKGHAGAAEDLKKRCLVNKHMLGVGGSLWRVVGVSASRSLAEAKKSESKPGSRNEPPKQSPKRYLPWPSGKNRRKPQFSCSL